MDPIAARIRAHLDHTGQSMRAFSLELGQGEKFVADILQGKSGRPRGAALRRLSEALGEDLGVLVAPRRLSVADALQLLRTEPPVAWSRSKVRGAITALGWYARARGAAGSGATELDRTQLRDWLSATSAAAHGLDERTFATYASLLRSVLDLLAGRGRPARIDDVEGPWSDLHRIVLDRFGRGRAGLAGPFFVWCASGGLGFADVDAETFADYHAHRVAMGKITVDDARDRKIVQETRGLWNMLATDPALADMGIAAAASPFPDGRDRYGMPPALLAPLLEEFDRKAAPWARGETDPDGTPVDVVLDRLAPIAVAQDDPRKARLRAYLGDKAKGRAKERAERLLAAGVLVGRARWSEDKTATARAAIKSLAMALWSKTGFVAGSIAELVDADVLEAAATALEEATDANGLGSGYVETTLKCAKKLACGYVRAAPEALATLAELTKSFAPDFAGISPRNRLKLQQLTPERIERFKRMSADIIAEANAEIAARRRAGARGAGDLGRAALTPAIARKLEVALAHDILLARPPRVANLLSIDLDRHPRRRADGGVTIEFEPQEVKNKVRFAIPLGATQSTFFDAYVEKVRPVLLTEACEAGTLLFPPRRGDGRRTSLPRRLVAEVKARVGADIHPHLYRHIVGWIWLKADPSALPKVQKLLGHKKLETTLQFYVELDEALCLQEWADLLEEKSHVDGSEGVPGGRARGGLGAGRRRAA